MARRPGPAQTGLPQWIRPQLTELVDAPPEGPDRLHKIKYDGYRMHARLDHGALRLLTRTGLDWTHKYPAIAKAVSSIGASQAYLHGELCGVSPDGVSSFSMIQLASDSGNAAALMKSRSLGCRTGPMSAQSPEESGSSWMKVGEHVTVNPLALSLLRSVAFSELRRVARPE